MFARSRRESLEFGPILKEAYFTGSPVEFKRRHGLGKLAIAREPERQALLRGGIDVSSRKRVLFLAGRGVRLLRVHESDAAPDTLITLAEQKVIACGLGLPHAPGDYVLNWNQVDVLP